MPTKDQGAFTSRMSRWEYAAAIGYIPVHVYLLPRLIFGLFEEGQISALGGNVVCYTIAAVLLFFFLRRFFFREFNALCDYGPAALLEIVKAYGVLLLCNMAINLALLLLGRAENPNNEAVFSLAGEDLGMTTAVAVFLAPIVEEAMFRGGVFGLLRRRNRLAAYAVSVALFAVYHIWGFAADDPAVWIYLLQYLPAGVLLARVYEKTNSLWSAIFLHMTVNGVSILALSMLGKLI
ncbi:MAG: CPBP family intramembrane metalloprotease [Oscillospiraceae bacterium]|nr:CPBP family intramembrane metalloprotease [Oscillospiraceae bacterium]